MRLPSDKCFAIIKQFERYRPTAYLPTRNDVWTCGWGHTKGVTTTTTCDYATAQAWLNQDVGNAVSAVNQHVTAPLTQNQFDALVSLTFNIGATAFEESTLLRKLNDRDYIGASNEFSKWVKQRMQTLPGLVTRREEERQLFIKP